MSITYSRAAEVLGMAVSFNGCGRTDSDELKEAVNTAVLVLRQKAVDFQPLSMIELRNMDKQIVYCAELNMDVRVAASKTGWITIHYPLKTEAYCERAHGLTLYRSPRGVAF